MEHATDSSFLQYILAHSSPEYHESLVASHLRIGNAALRLCEAQEEYLEAIKERIALNNHIRRCQ
jgi:hypothetical protein